ncbi:hypothetical protein ACFRAQ_34720 [Nocardia sp. NPDC056611]|uniref:hypothetical protein n=1 Tax=Nocardia sp. NPDC056611 TaxID=3345877 RepID=UPI00366B76A1
MSYPAATAEEIARIFSAWFPETRDDDELSESDWHVVAGYFIYDDGGPIETSDLRIELERYVGGRLGSYRRDLEMVWKVQRIDCNDDHSMLTYFRKTGIYESFEGSRWTGDFERVRATEKTVIDYESVNS